ncbi:radical SAM family heme chaperone HemW [Amphibiibacter pelophylacis]|uniref:Radical SAM family heme chaperone HemW n=1 Tax=Amphibiibacter pelophylacis TaxID=1799477 RepID=A0ACC6P086_9BURK
MRPSDADGLPDPAARRRVIPLVPEVGRFSGSPGAPGTAPASRYAATAVPPDHPLADFLGDGPLSLPGPPPLSLYIHLPWCLRKCPYCDFNSHERAGLGDDGHLPPGLEADYVRALIADLDAALPLVWGRPVISVFLGGGTPSLFQPQTLADLLSAVRARLPLAPEAEITLEANPGTFESGRYAAYAQAGINRLSIGVQSLNDTHLRALGRVHDAAQARAAVAEAQRHFERFNIDLMYALPGQELADLARDVDAVLALQPPHLSLYHLTLERNTRFFSQPPEGLPDADLASDMLDLILARTARAGLGRYEVSAFARSEALRCTHNLNYWAFGDYLGLGAGAHSKLSFAHRIWRQTRWREPQQYMTQALAGRAVSSQDEVAPQHLPFEFMLNALRLKDGVPHALWAERTGLPPAHLATAWRKAAARGWVPDSPFPPRQWVTTPRGFDFLSDAQELFLP